MNKRFFPSSKYTTFFLLILFLACFNMDFSQKPAFSLEHLMRDCPQKNLPVTDTTNFDNYTPAKRLSENEVKLLSLQEIAGEYATEFGLNYSIKLSDKFTSIVVSYHKGEELYTVLVNYDQNNHVTGSLVIAYDEIAESWFRKEGEIFQNQILVRFFSYLPETPGIKRKIYDIGENGEITQI